MDYEIEIYPVTSVTKYESRDIEQTKLFVCFNLKYFFLLRKSAD